MTLFVETAEWFLNERGITKETLHKCGVTQETDGTLVFPYRNGKRFRQVENNIPTRDFRWETGTKANLFETPSKTTSIAYIVEGETDALRLYQALEDAEVFANVFGVPGFNTWKELFTVAFQNYESVYIILDNDPDYNIRSKVEEVAKKMRHDIGRKAKIIHLPEDVKDICEFFKRYDFEALDFLVNKIVNSSKWTPLNLRIPPKPVDWLVAGLVAKEDLCLIMGDSGLGKSWLMQQLAVSMVIGEDEFIGRPLRQNGRVMYIDEENAENVVRRRISALGLGVDHPNLNDLRYYHRQNIRLNTSADDLLEEALDFKPALIVLDSLTRLHTEDENNAGAMSKLFNDSLLPLARESGATVCFIHHANKTEGNSSFRRTRGSSDIPANVDTALDLRGVSEGDISVALFKSRHKQDGETIRISIVNTGKEQVKVMKSYVEEIF